MEKGPLDKQTEELLTAYFRGELEGLELQRVEAWLAESAAVPPDQCGYVVLAMEPERMETRFL